MRVAGWLLQGVAAGAVLATALLAHRIFLDRSDVPELEPFLRFDLPTVGRIYDSRGDLLFETATEYREVVTYDEIPIVMKQALLAAEDRNFFSHGGIDFRVFPRVAWKNLLHLRAENSRRVFPQGGSTLTQQLVRGYFLRGMTEKESGPALLAPGPAASVAARFLGTARVNKLVRKIEEIRLSLWLEEAMKRQFGSQERAKQEILARYASFLYLGEGRYGFAAAAKHYFGRPLAGFTEEDASRAALLAGMAKCPGEYGPGARDRSAVLRRRNEVLGLMARRGFLSPEKAARMKAQPLLISRPMQRRPEAPAVVDHVLAEMSELRAGGLKMANLVRGGIAVRTTVDRRAQAIINEALENGLDQYGRRHRAGAGSIQGAVVVLANDDARILAEVGGRGRFQDRPVSPHDFNRALDAMRQPGSAMKPFVYLAAFRAGASLDSPIPDEPIGLPMGAGQPTKWIRNYDEMYKGEVPIRQALAESRNAATVWLAREVGMELVLDTARQLGIHSPMHRYLSTSLGAAEVRLLELANAYRAIASGLSAEPFVIREITDATGAQLHAGGRTVTPLGIDPDALGRIQEGLRGVVRLPWGTAHALADGPGFPIAVMGKTGTTSEFRDALFVGSTWGPRGITVAVRLGYDDNRRLGEKETGARAALPIFREIVLRLYKEGLVGPPPSFPVDIEQHIDEWTACEEERQMALAREEQEVALGDGYRDGTIITNADLPRVSFVCMSPADEASGGAVWRRPGTELEGTRAVQASTP